MTNRQDFWESEYGFSINRYHKSPQVSENDLVSFWSEELPINEFSNNNGLISYELMTRISSRVNVKVI